MLHRYFYLASLFVMLMPVPASAEIDAAYSQALQTAEHYLVATDKGHWTEAYQMASTELRLLTDQQQWVDEQSRYRQLLGPPLERQLTAVRFRDHYPGLPDGDYLIALYQVRTPMKEKAQEVLVLTEGSSTWQVCRYMIR